MTQSYENVESSLETPTIWKEIIFAYDESSRIAWWPQHVIRGVITAIHDDGNGIDYNITSSTDHITFPVWEKRFLRDDSMRLVLAGKRSPRIHNEELGVLTSTNVVGILGDTNLKADR